MAKRFSVRMVIREIILLMDSYDNKKQCTASKAGEDIDKISVRKLK